MKKTLLLTGVASLFALNAHALDLTPYFGADYNYTFTHHVKAYDSVVPSHYHSGSLDFGLKVLPYLSFEMFADYSKHEKRSGIRTNYHGFGVDALGMLPFGCYGEWKILGTLGLGRYYSEIKDKGAALSDSTYDWGYRFGGGVQYDITDNWAARLMYRHVIFNKHHFAYTNFDVLSLGVRYSF